MGKYLYFINDQPCEEVSFLRMLTEQNVPYSGHILESMKRSAPSKFSFQGLSAAYTVTLEVRKV